MEAAEAGMAARNIAEAMQRIGDARQ